jgi:uncharacterized protein (TIGR00288 family)
MEILKELTERRGEARIDAEDAHQAALLIDFDNVTMGIRSNLGAELRSLLNSDVIRGKVAVQRAYADWRRYPQYIVPLSEASIDLIFAPAYGSSKKNATDIRLAIDALELVFVRPEIRTYILMSGDSDFSSLVLKLKEYGKYIIGVGIQESSSDLLVQNCDEYYSYSALSGLSKTSDQVIESHDPWLLTAKAVNKMVERGDTMRSDRLKQVMLEIDPSFNEKEHGYNKFNRFVVQAASKGLVSIQKMENGQYGVAPGDKGRKERKAEEPEKKKEKKEGRAPRSEARAGRDKERSQKETAPTDKDTRRARPKLTMESALELLDRALGILLESGAESVRDSDVKRRLLELDPDFDEGELGYSKFSKFLQAAEEQGAVKLERGPNGNYQVARAKKGRRKATDGSAADRVESGESTMRRLARFFFGTEKAEDESPAPEAAKEAAPAEPPAERRPQTSRDPRERREARGPRGGDERPRRGKRGPRAQDADGEASARSRKGPRTGRGRGESRAPAERRGGERRQRERPPRRSGREEPRPRKSDEPTAPSVAEAEPVTAPEAPPIEAPIVESRVAEPSTSVAPAPKPEPKVSEAASTEREVSEAPSAEPAVSEAPSGQPVVTNAPLPGSPRGTIRGRWGKRGRYRPAGAPPPIFEGQRGDRGEATRAAGKTPDAGAAAETGRTERATAGSDTGSIVAHLTAYSGVGGKTAEALVEAFGSDTFRVLDEEPDRVRAVLPGNRAERVIEARREERDAGA